MTTMRVAAAAAALLAMLGSAGAAMAECSSGGTALMKNLSGGWKGRGSVTPLNGAEERLSCRISYSGTGPALSQNINCAGTDYKFTASANVKCAGDRITGSWQDQVGSSGGVNGSISGTNIGLNVDGPNFKGRVSISMPSASRHSVTISQFDNSKGRWTPVANMTLLR